MIKVENIYQSFGNLTLFEDFSLEFPEGKITTILGPSGCGKTTLLNILAGLVKAGQGTVVTPDNVSYLFQEPRLLPWLTVRQNIALVLKTKMTGAEIEERVVEALKATGLMKYKNYYPSQLSGGMRQRVAMARAFAFDAPLLLMDEPFKSLDIKTRFQSVKEFLLLWQHTARTVVMVTHDIQEALWLGNKIIILSDKPAKILREIKLDLPYDDRRNNGQLAEVEDQLWQLFLGIDS